MKALKCWGWLLAGAAVVLHLVGVFTGEYNEYAGLYGKSVQAQWMTGLTVACVLLAVTVMLVVHAMNEKTKK